MSVCLQPLPTPATGHCVYSLQDSAMPPPVPYSLLYSLLAFWTAISILVEACMRTPEAKDEIMIATTVTTTTTTATPICAGNIPPCNPPANSAGLITNTMADDTSLDTPGTFVCYTASWIHPGLSFPLKPPAHIESAQVGTCTCNQAGLVEHFFTGATQNRVFFPTTTTCGARYHSRRARVSATPARRGGRSATDPPTRATTFSRSTWWPSAMMAGASSTPRYSAS